MNQKAESLTFVTILCASFLLIGLMFVTFSHKAAITGKTTVQSVCAIVDGNNQRLISTEECCIEIRKSDGCTPKNNLFECKGERTIITDEETIKGCQ